MLNIWAQWEKVFLPLYYTFIFNRIISADKRDLNSICCCYHLNIDFYSCNDTLICMLEAIFNCLLIDLLSKFIFSPMSNISDTPQFTFRISIPFFSIPFWTANRRFYRSSFVYCAHTTHTPTSNSILFFRSSDETCVLCAQNIFQHSLYSNEIRIKKNIENARINDKPICRNQDRCLVCVCLR